MSLPLLLFAAGAAARVLARDAGLRPFAASLAGVLVAADPAAAGAAGTSGPAVTALVLAGAAALGRGREVPAGAALGIAAALRPVSVIPSIVLLLAEAGPRRAVPSRALVLTLLLAVPAALVSIRSGGAVALTALGFSDGKGLDELFRFSLVLLPFALLALVREISSRGAVLPILAHGVACLLIALFLGNGGDPGATAPLSASLRVGGAAGFDAFLAMTAGSAPALGRAASALALALFAILEFAAPAQAFRRALSGSAARGEELLPAAAAYLRDEIPAGATIAAFRVGALRAFSGRSVENLARGRLDKPRFFVDPTAGDPWSTFDFLRPDVFVANADLGEPDRRILGHAELYARYGLLRAFRGADRAAVYVFGHGRSAVDEGEERLVRPREEIGHPTRAAAESAEVLFVDDGRVALPAIRLAPPGGNEASGRAKIGFFASLRAAPRLRFSLAYRSREGFLMPEGGGIAEVVAISGSRLETLFSLGLGAETGGAWQGPFDLDLARFAGRGVALFFEAAGRDAAMPPGAAIFLGEPRLTRVDGRVVAQDPPADLSQLVPASKGESEGLFAVEFDGLAAPRGPFTTGGDASVASPDSGRLVVRSAGPDPFVLSPPVALETSAYRFLDLELRARRDDGRRTDLFQASFALRPPRGAAAPPFEAEIPCDGSLVRLRVPLHGGGGEAGPPPAGEIVTRFRLDPLTAPGEVEFVRLVVSRY